MFLRFISIRSLGSVERFERNFTSDVNVVSTRYTHEVSHAMRVVLNHRDSFSPGLRVSGSTRIEALVRLFEKDYLVMAKPTPGQNDLCIRVYDTHGGERTQEYVYLTAHCPEQDLSDVFLTNDGQSSFKPIQYAEEDRHDTLSGLAGRTDRLSETKAFRSYLKAYIRDFKPETIRAGKRYELCPDASGKYAVRYLDEVGMPVLLSESEQLLFRYLCFLRTAEFWQGFEAIRNLHGITKPILIGNFLERLDESIDTQDILERTRRLNRQIIILTR